MYGSMDILQYRQKKSLPSHLTRLLLELRYLQVP